MVASKSVAVLFPCALALSALVTTGCTPSGEPDEPTADCSTSGQNAFLFNLMKDVYLWYDGVPDLDHSSYASPEALLADLVDRSRDRWSYISIKSDYEAYFREGQTLGLGFRWGFDLEGTLRLALVYPSSPAGAAGLRRGDRVLALNGVDVEEIVSDDRWAELIGPDEEGHEISLTIERPGEEPFTVAVQKAWYGVTTVLNPRVVQTGSSAVGYLMLTTFIEPSVEELDRAFATFRERQVTELVLDLRYNGGGRLAVERHLASLIHRPATAGALLDITAHNDRHGAWDKRATFEELDQPALPLSRLVVITSSGTASASETLINSLRPYIDVKLVGGTTHGKPVGMHGWDYCDKMMHPISFRVLNAAEEGDYYDGFAPDCPADDTLNAELGETDETCLAEALHLLEHGACSAPAQPIGAGERRRAPPPEIRWDGLRREIGAL
ncbi:peptidase [Sorangium cellulosum]|uniref:Peptidase n=1 Tax=Sorangium cellulosum TaxID=56 RepID=A0A150NZV2_SORCE|nr:peptidase [Sorangium cellulosum]